MPEPSLTLVTGFWLQKHELVRTAAVYVRLFEELVRHVDNAAPIVCCIDPRVEALVRGVAERNPHARLLLQPMPFEALRYGGDLGRFDDMQPANGSLSIRDTIEYTAIVWSKPATVATVAAENPFRTSHLAWIDFGMPHVVELADVDWREVIAEATRTDRVRFCERMATAAHEVEDAFYFYSNNSARVCGGLLTGTPKGFVELAELFEIEIARMVPTGTYALEEQVLAAICAKHPNLFDRWYADYYGLLKNIRHVRRDVDTVLANLTHCREESLWTDGVEIARLLLDSGSAYVRFEPEQCFHLLDAGLACAVHTDRELADHLGRTVLALYHHSRVGRGMMKGKWRRSLQASLQAIDLDFPQKPWSWEEMCAQPQFPTWMACF